MTPTKPVPGHEVQQRIYGNNCFGCGPANEGGLHLEFHLEEARQRFVCEFILPNRFEGPPLHAHGGIIATILDEAMGKVSKLRSIIAVTGTMQVNYIRPVPLAKPLVTEGWEVGVNGREHFRAAEIRGEKGEILATSTGTFIEVDPARMFAKFLKESKADAT
ncbi:MAG TPA: PaaI family thioesterase [Candidatus Angelobacter sp.]|nr:PaaI family thioesterase [Candidatus Angelobacter sp.]